MFDPLKPHFYIVKLGFTGVYIIFLFPLKNVDCMYSLEQPLTSTHNLCFEEKYENYQKFLSENFHIFNIFEQACFRYEQIHVIRFRTRWINDRQRRLWSDRATCSICSGDTLFTLAWYLCMICVNTVFPWDIKLLFLGFEMHVPVDDVLFLSLRKMGFDVSSELRLSR